MRVMVVGNGAREHALAWAASHSAGLTALAVAPGNAGTARLAESVPVDPMDTQALAAAARGWRADLVIVGPDDPLAAGAVDALQAAGLRAFGPTRAAAQIEASKAWSKQFMGRHGIPTAPFEVFDDPGQAHRFVDARPDGWERVVIKADGLARGKGVVVCDDEAEAHLAISAAMEQHVFGHSGDRVLVERRIEGPEASFFALCGGQTALPMGNARDHKRIWDGERGPNTGGMGAYSPTRLITPEVHQDVMARIVQPAIRGLAAEGRPFVGFLYVGLMFTTDGPQVIEFNARFGDPEAQAIIPRLQSPLVELVEAALDARLESTQLRWHDGAACAVCVASAGYPDQVRDGVPVSGLEAAAPDVQVFHAGTIQRGGEVITSGGRVLTVVGQGGTLRAARVRAYQAVEGISFEGMQYRRDIGALEG